jgi:hypothetical protein
MYRTDGGKWKQKNKKEISNHLLAVFFVVSRLFFVSSWASFGCFCEIQHWNFCAVRSLTSVVSAVCYTTPVCIS